MNKFFGVIAAFFMACTMSSVVGAAEYTIDNTQVEALTVNTNVCNMVGSETIALVDAFEEGRADKEIVEIFGSAISKTINDGDNYLALWMVGYARDHIRSLMSEAFILKFVKMYPQYTKAQAIGYHMKQACAKLEGKAENVPKRVLLVKGKSV